MPVLVTELSNGVFFPAVALGAWQLKADAPSTRESVITALNEGYRAVDDAHIYQNEHVIGPIVSAFDYVTKTIPSPPVIKPCAHYKVVSDEDFEANFAHPHGTPSDRRRTFVTTKIWVSDYTPEGTRKEVEEHLKNFSRSSADMVLMHWPGPHTGFGSAVYDERSMTDPNNAQTRITVWRTLEELYAEGKVRSIGVSNFLPKHLLPLIQDVKARQAAGDKKAMLPMTNQIEISAFCCPSDDLESLCAEHGIVLTSYSSLGSYKAADQFIGHPTVTAIARKHNVSGANVLLRWCLEKGYNILPRSTKAERVKSNFQVFHFSLDANDMKEMAALNIGAYQNIHPELIA